MARNESVQAAGGQGGTASQLSAERLLYVRVTDPEGWFPGGAFVQSIQAEMRRFAMRTGVVPGLDEGGRSVGVWARREAERFRQMAAGMASDGGRAVLVRRAVLHCAPTALNSGAWLQWLSSPANADDPAVLSLLALYAADTGVGCPQASRGSAYLALMRRLQLSESATPVAQLQLDHRIPDWAFRLPAVLLAMSRRPGDFTPEIVGADLCLRTVGLLPPLTMVRDAYPHAADWTAIDPSSVRDTDEGSGLECSRNSVDMVLAGSGDDVMPRVLHGFSWALAALQAWSGRLYADLDSARDPAYEMAELLRLRAREGSAYHHNFTIEGRPLAAWLEQSRTDPSGLLSALSRSKLVRPGRSRESSLATSLVGERGPMFRVFAPEDLEVISRWIDALPPRDGQLAGSDRCPAIPQATSDQPLEIATPVGDICGEGADRRRISLRDAYHGLLHRNESPALRRFARDYVHGWLRRACVGIDKGETRLPSTWEPGGLRPWLLEQHDDHSRDFQRIREDPIPSREALIDSTVQLAPLTLIDGGWLHGFTDYEHAASELGHFLFQTYWDELGNGIPLLNHPLIYRQVLAEMGVELPPTRSSEFARWTGFRDASFELPVYWLSIGRFPQSFMAEILGLNLAMELSGVGGTYRRAHIALRKYGYSTRFVDIHNTIDNVATGHSAWAADAVDSYLTATLTARGARAQAEAWGRVRAGFRSLTPPGGWKARRAERTSRRAGAAR